MTNWLTYFPVTGHFYDVEGPDSAGDTNVNQLKAISAWVTFTPRVPEGFTALVRDLDLGNGETADTAVALAPIVAHIVDGALCTVDSVNTEGINLLANTTALALSSQGIGDLIYDVRFDSVTYAGKSRLLQNFAFVAPVDNSPVDITDSSLVRLQYLKTKPLQYAYTPPQAVVSPFGQTLIQQSSAAAALGTLGLSDQGKQLIQVAGQAGARLVIGAVGHSEIVDEVTATLAADSTVVAAAETAVDAVVTSDQLVTSADHRLLQWTEHQPTLFAVTDAEMNRTWLDVSQATGGPTPTAVQILRDTAGALVGTLDVDGDILAAVIDQDYNRTDLTVRRSDGQFTDDVVDRLAPRIASRTGGFVATDRYVTPTGEVLPILPDLTKFATFGDSIMGYLQETLALGSIVPNYGATDWYQGAVGGQGVELICARIGCIPALCTIADNTIPASGSVTVAVSNCQDSKIHWENWSTYAGTLGGVPGTLSFEASPQWHVLFNRTTAGDPVTIDADTPFLPTATPAYRSAPSVLMMGINSLAYWGDGGETRALQYIDSAFKWFSSLARRTIVMGIWVMTNGAGLETTQSCNAQLAERYGDLFFDTAGYVDSEQVWTDTGITPTSDDLDQQAAGVLPYSLSRADSLHPCDALITALGVQLKARIDSLHWYG